MQETAGASATVCVAGGRKTPEALRNVSQLFFEYQQAVPEIGVPEPAKVIKRRPEILLSTVSLLAVDAAEGWVRIATLGQHLRLVDPVFTAKKYGHSSLQAMVFS